MTDDRFMIRAVVLAPPDVVFAALTEVDSLCVWFAEEADCSLAEGRFSFWGRYTPFGGEPRQRLLATDSRTLLRFAWKLAEVDTVVEVRIADTGTGDTELTVTQQPVPVGIDRFWCLALGNLSNFAEGRSSLRRHDYLVSGEGAVTAEVDIDAPPDEVFAALVEPAKLARWIAAIAMVEVQTDGRCDFGWEDGSMTIEAVEPPRYLACRWRTPNRLDTVVRWTIELRDLGSRVTVQHTGCGAGTDCQCQQITWETMLVGLQRMVELGQSWHPIERRARLGSVSEVDLGSA